MIFIYMIFPFSPPLGCRPRRRTSSDSIAAASTVDPPDECDSGVESEDAAAAGGVAGETGPGIPSGDGPK